MKKATKFKSELIGKEVTFTVSEKLSKLDPQTIAPQKLEEANKTLRELKTPLPK